MVNKNVYDGDQCSLTNKPILTSTIGSFRCTVLALPTQWSSQETLRHENSLDSTPSVQDYGGWLSTKLFQMSGAH